MATQLLRLVIKLGDVHHFRDELLKKNDKRETENLIKMITATDTKNTCWQSASKSGLLSDSHRLNTTAWSMMGGA